MHAELKKKLFVTTVEAILLYGCETWTLSERDESRLDGCYTRTRMMRTVMNITRTDTSNLSKAHETRDSLSSSY